MLRSVWGEQLGVLAPKQRLAKKAQTVSDAACPRSRCSMQFAVRLRFWTDSGRAKQPDDSRSWDGAEGGIRTRPAH
jgi:hypothetical protein